MTEPEKLNNERRDPTNELRLHILTIPEAFDRLDAQQWIDENRVETDGVFDIEATAKKIGIPLIFDMPTTEDGKLIFASGCITGLGNRFGEEPIVVHIDPTREQVDHKLTY